MPGSGVAARVGRMMLTGTTLALKACQGRCRKRLGLGRDITQQGWSFSEDPIRGAEGNDTVAGTPIISSLYSHQNITFNFIELVLMHDCSIWHVPFNILSQLANHYTLIIHSLFLCSVPIAIFIFFFVCLFFKGKNKSVIKLDSIKKYIKNYPSWKIYYTFCVVRVHFNFKQHLDRN